MFRADENTLVVLYRRAMTWYPERFRTQYGEAMVETFALELARVRASQSATAIASFAVFITLDWATSVLMTRIRGVREHIPRAAVLMLVIAVALELGRSGPRTALLTPPVCAADLFLLSSILVVTAAIHAFVASHDVRDRNRIVNDDPEPTSLSTPSLPPI
jgi:hypothetical protein